MYLFIVSSYNIRLGLRRNIIICELYVLRLTSLRNFLRKRYKAWALKVVPFFYDEVLYQCTHESKKKKHGLVCQNTRLYC